MMMLRLDAITKTYSSGGESLEVLKGLELRVEEATTVVITGESGSGKSTLLNLIGGLDNPSSGRVMVAGKDISQLSEEERSVYRNRYVGFVFQSHYLLRDFTALENVMMPSLIKGGTLSAGRGRAQLLLEDVGLRTRLQHYPLELSGGERQRVAVARALMNDPTLVLADEPLGNLDEKNSGLVENLLFEMVTKYSKTLILVTHTMRTHALFRHLRLEHGVLHEQ